MKLKPEAHPRSAARTALTYEPGSPLRSTLTGLEGAGQYTEALNKPSALPKMPNSVRTSLGFVLFAATGEGFHR